MGTVQGKVFLCHNSEDKPDVEKVRKLLLESYGIETFMDKYDFQVFQGWEDQLQQEISKALAAVIFVGGSGLGPWQTKEVEDFFKRSFSNHKFPAGLVLLPSCPDDMKASSKPELEWLSRRHWVDFRQADPDPMSQLILALTQNKNRRIKTIPPEEHLNELRKNRQLRLDLLEQYAKKIEEKVKSLKHEITIETSNISSIDREIDAINRSLLESCGDPHLRASSEFLAAKKNALVKASCEYTITEFPEFTKHLDQLDTKIEVMRFNTDMGHYLDKICLAMSSSRPDILDTEFSRTSNLSPDAFRRSLREVKRRLNKLRFSDCSKIDTYMDHLIDTIEMEC